jgi:hypothetical protein
VLFWFFFAQAKKTDKKSGCYFGVRFKIISCIDLEVSCSIIMTPQEFQKTIVKTNWYDKYYYYFISLAAIAGSIYLFYDIGTNPLRYKSKHSYAIALIAYSCLFLLGCYAIYLIPRRYKVLTISSSLPVEKKKEIISTLLNKLSISYEDTKDCFYFFRYRRKWWASDYEVYLLIDNQKFYFSVLGTTHAYPDIGFIDFGGAQRVRRKIISIIKSLMDNK